MRKAKEKPVRGLEEIADLRLYTLAEISPVVKINEATLKKYIKTGRLKAAVIGGKWRVTAENLKAFLETSEGIEIYKK